MAQWSAVHRVVGFLFVAVFLATGLYMRWHTSVEYRDDLALRMMYRSAHIYILLGALLNLGVTVGRRGGARPRRRRGRLRLEALGSLLVVCAPGLFLAAFFLEASPGRVARPIVLAGAAASVAGVLMLLWSGRGRS